MESLLKVDTAFSTKDIQLGIICAHTVAFAGLVTNDKTCVICWVQ